MGERLLNGIAKHQYKLIGVFLIFSLIAPAILRTPYAYRLVTVALMYVLLAQGLNFIVGYLGQNTFGHSAFWGIGAYTTAILATKLGWSTIPAMAASILITGVLGLLLGVPSMKMKGVYIVIVTVGFCEIIRLVELNWTELTNGPLGIKSIPKPDFFGWEIKSNIAFYYYILVLVVFITYILARLLHSRFGRAVVAIREDELAASAMGIHTFQYKIWTFAISAMVAGAAGTFYAQYIGYIDSNAFTTQVSTEILVMVIFGGLGNMIGPFLGAGILTVLPEIIRGLSDYRMLIYGFLLVVLMLVRPTGVMGKVNFRYIRQRIMNQTQKNGMAKSEKEQG